MKNFHLYPSQQEARNCLYHRGDIVLIDRVLKCSSESILTQSLITLDNLFLKSLGEMQVFPTYQSIELIAQSLGCYQRIYQSHLGNQEKPKIGFLLSVRNFEILIPYVNVGQLLFTEVSLSTQDINGFSVCDGRIFCDTLEEKNLICHSSVSVFSPQESSEFLRKNDV